MRIRERLRHEWRHPKEAIILVLLAALVVSLATR